MSIETNITKVVATPTEESVDEISAIGCGVPDATPDPFDPKSLAIKGNPADSVGVKRALTIVPVRKPNKQEFFRTHSDEGYAIQMAILDLKTENEIYAVTPAVALSIPGETRMVRLTTSITRQGNVFLWPVILPSPDGREMAWHSSAREAAERAQSRWVRMVANMGGGYYDIWEADSSIAEPQWPDHTFQKLLKVAFGNGRLIDREDHPVLQQLLGRA
jgi:hypothetical protein